MGRYVYFVAMYSFLKTCILIESNSPEMGESHECVTRSHLTLEYVLYEENAIFSTIYISDIIFIVFSVLLFMSV